MTRVRPHRQQQQQTHEGDKGTTNNDEDYRREKALYELYGEYKKSRTKVSFLPVDASKVPYGPFRCHRPECCVVIPYRDSTEQPRAHMLTAIVDLFERARIHVVVVEQTSDDRKFNKGAILNVGYLYARALRRFDVFVFNDVDLLPDVRLLRYYGICAGDAPVHMAGPRQQHKYPYSDIYGGIISITGSQFERINGFPNSFWGWGGEDDALYNRVARTYGITYRPVDGFATEMHHPNTHEIPAMVNAQKRDNILGDLVGWKTDGVNSSEFFRDTQLTLVRRGEWRDHIRVRLPHYTSNPTSALSPIRVPASASVMPHFLL